MAQGPAPRQQSGPEGQNSRSPLESQQAPQSARGRAWASPCSRSWRHAWPETTCQDQPIHTANRGAWMDRTVRGGHSHPSALSGQNQWEKASRLAEDLGAQLVPPRSMT